MGLIFWLCQSLHTSPFFPCLPRLAQPHLGMRFLDLNRYSLISSVATLVAIAYSSHKSLFHTPSSLLNLGLLQSLEPLLKDVIPFGPDTPFPHPSLVESLLKDAPAVQLAHSRLLSGAAGIGNGFRPSVFQSMLAERYLRFRTPSPAVLMQLQVILSYLQNEKLCVLVSSLEQCLGGSQQKPFVPDAYK